MIEMIFIIVVIGILATIAIPRLATGRTDAMATVCVQEVGQSLSEVAVTYTRDGHAKFSTARISSMSNINTADTIESGSNGFVDAVVDGSDGVDYWCDGEKIVNFRGEVEGQDYNLTVTLEPTLPASPVAFQAREKIKKNILNNETKESYSL